MVRFVVSYKDHRKALGDVHFSVEGGRLSEEDGVLQIKDVHGHVVLSEKAADCEVREG